MRYARTAAVAALAVVLAGCGGSSGGSGQTVTSGNPTVAQIASANHLTGVQKCQGGEMFVSSVAIGYKGGVKYGIDTFSSTEGRDSWLKVAKGFGGFPDTYQQGETWVLYRAEDQSPGC